MNSESPKTPREEMEAWLTSLLLGELSEGEAAAVRELMKHDPELAKLHARLQQAIGLLREAEPKTAVAPEQTEPLKLPEERRRKLLAAFKIPPLKATAQKSRLFPQFGRLQLVAALVVLAFSSFAIISFLALSHRGRGFFSQSRLIETLSDSPEETVSSNPKQVADAMRRVQTPDSTPNVYSANVVGYVDVPATNATTLATTPKPAITVVLPVTEIPPSSEPATSTVVVDSPAVVFPVPLESFANVRAPAPPTPPALPQPAPTTPPAEPALATASAPAIAAVADPDALAAPAERAAGSKITPLKAAPMREPTRALAESAGKEITQERLMERYGRAVTELRKGTTTTDSRGRPSQPTNTAWYGWATSPAVTNHLGLPEGNTTVSGLPQMNTAGDTVTLDVTRGYASQGNFAYGGFGGGGGVGGTPAAGSAGFRLQGPQDKDEDGRLALAPTGGVSVARLIEPATGLPRAHLDELSLDRSGVEAEVNGIYLGEQFSTAPAPVVQAGAVEIARVPLYAESSVGQTAAPPSSVDGSSRMHNKQGNLLFADKVTGLQRELRVGPITNSLSPGVPVLGDTPIAGRPLKGESKLAAGIPLELKSKSFKAAEEDRAKEARYLISERGRAPASKKRVVGVEQDLTPPRTPSTNAPIPQPEIQASENNFSTFSLNVSDVSFKLAMASLEKGQMPDAASVRSEEFLNAFDYRDSEPAPGAPIAFAWERARYPFAHNRDLLRFSLKTAAQGRVNGRALNLVLLLDNSGSMERADRVRIIREALHVLTEQLQPHDKLSVVLFSRTARLVADGISGDKAKEAVEQVIGLTPQGGTNLEEAMNLAYATALKHYLANGINRVVLLTDGAANLGDVEPDSLKQKVEANRRQGIALDCFGIGWEGFNDDLLEVLSRNGDGRYGFINSPEEAASEFAGQLAGALKVAASDVKVQVEFNPRRVTSYRQIGYAKHQLTKEQFRDNTVDAAEIAAQEAGNALYTVEVNPAGEGPLCTVRCRFKIPGTTDYREQAWDVPFTGNALSLEQSSPAMRLAASAAAFAEWLVASPFAAEVTPDRVLGLLSGVPEIYGADSRPKKLEWMIRQAKSLEGK